MTARVVYDRRVLDQLPAGVRIREIGVTGREFITDKHPGRLWYGATPCTTHALEMPVEVIE